MKLAYRHRIPGQGYRARSLLFALIAAAIIFSFLPRYSERTWSIEPSSVRMLFIGDLMFDRTIRSVAEKKGYDHMFSCVADYLRAFDLVVGNLEGPITDRQSLSKGTKPGDPNNTTFTFSPLVIPALTKHNVRALSLGNNHMRDFGRQGAEATASLLKQNGILGFGEPATTPYATTSIRGSQIGFVSFNQFLDSSNSEETVALIWKAIKENDFVAVYAHWGDEYVPSTDYQRALAHRFIDAGAHLVIGSHPHVVQEHEIYKGRHIFYSLGNFIFDQYWIEDVRTGGGVEAVLRGNDISISERRFDIRRDGLTCLKE